MKKSKSRREKKRQQRELRRKQREEGLNPPQIHTPSNCKSPYQSEEEETTARGESVSGLARIMRQQLPTLLKRLAKIPDPRDPKKTKYKITLLMLYGILVFVFQYSSRRAANTAITRPVFENNLRRLFPQLETLPHADTLSALTHELFPYNKSSSYSIPGKIISQIVVDRSES